MEGAGAGRIGTSFGRSSDVARFAPSELACRNWRGLLNLIVVKRATSEFTVERRYDVADTSIWAMPVMLGSDILVRDASGLMRLTPK